MNDQTPAGRPSDEKDKSSDGHADSLTQARGETLIESTRSLILINGGGAVAIVAWMQSIWKEPSAISMLRLQAIGVICLSVGAFLAGICPIIRFCSFYVKKKPLKNPLWWTLVVVTTLSALAFVAGMAIVVKGVWGALPTGP